MSLSFYILEGTWWSNREIPQVLPYFQALENSGNKIKLSHRTFWNARDIEYWISKIPLGQRSFLYFACHGDSQCLIPSDGRSPIKNEWLLNALSKTKKNAIEFLHFGCCEMISVENRRDSLENYLNASNAKWVSGYSKEVDWIPSTLLDLALVSQLAIPYHEDDKCRSTSLSKRGRKFQKDYEQLVRALGFSGAYRNKAGVIELFPVRHRK